ncbi:MAG: SoxR reducing system RseC family protein [Firmicutes bacterium]|nr:SoxR reducing system RseC family protein [Bacillota bacterium]
MKQKGFITKTEKKTANVIIRRETACGDKCSSCNGGCNVNATKVMIENKLNAKAGDYVEIRMETKMVMKSAFILYIIPLIMLIIGTGAGVYVFKNIGYNNYEIFGVLFGMFFLAISHIIIKIIDKRIKNNNGLKFEMKRILNK